MSESKLPNQIDKLVGQRLRWRRNEIGLTQPALAERLGITFQQLQKYENGKNRVSAGRLYEIAQTLETNITYFFLGAETIDETVSRRGLAEDEGDAGFAGLIDKDAVALVTAFQSISDPKVRKNILALVKSQAASDRRDDDGPDR